MHSYTRNVLIHRTKGTKIPISVSTAMIFESTNAHPKLWEVALLVNIRTLVRNMMTAPANTVDWKQIEIPTFVHFLLEEMDLLVTEYPNYRISGTVSFCAPDYRTLRERFPNAKFRENPSDKQQTEDNIYYAVRDYLMQMKEAEQLKFEVDFPESELSKSDTPTTILTSYPTDLLSQYQFPKLTLIESHTGILKPRRAWYTKLTSSKELTNVPFCKFTLLIFGDGKEIFAQSIKLKREVLAMASANNWHALTADERIRQSIKKSAMDDETKVVLFSYL